MKIELTHLWVTGFGWETTILVSEDFKELEVLGRNDEGVIFIGTQNVASKRQILKGTITRGAAT